MRVGIFGSGFGLYCYLPAITVGCRQQVLLPERYQQRMHQRADVRDLMDLVEWAPSDEVLLERAEMIVISQRPSDQVAQVRRCIRQKNIGGLILEKPLAPDPIQATQLLGEIERSGKRFCIGYLFRHTEWGKALRARAHNVHEIRIEWSFRAHHYAVDARNWKRQVSSGGGALRFYGIHLIALLAELGYNQIITSSVFARTVDEAEKWNAVIAGDGLPKCYINLNTNCDRNSFKVSAGHATGAEVLSFRLSDPFDSPEKSNTFDDRVAVLTQHCREFFRGQSTPGGNYTASTELWHRIEAKTQVDHGWMGSASERTSGS